MSEPFPADWPCDCPPDDAEDAAGMVYRIVKHAPPIAVDFETHHEAGKMPKAPPCLRCGLSVFRALAEAAHQRELFPKLGDRIASGELTAAHGKTKLTEGKQPSHTTWWPYINCDRASPFHVVQVF